MRLPVLMFACAAFMTACYSGSRAAHDLNPAWRGHARVELEARLGVPRVVQPQPDGNTVVRWIRRGHHVELPRGHFDLQVTPTSFDLDAALTPGSVRSFDYELASAVIDQAGAVLRFDAPWLVAGIPRGVNARTGVVFGLHGGMGRLDDAKKPLPAVGAYIGGMLGPRTALVGAYAFVNGKNGDDYVNGHSWALAAQYWPTERLAVQLGPAMVLDVDPGPSDLQIAPGAVGALSLAMVRSGSFVLDLRLDTTVSTASAFGTVGIGINVN